MNGRLIMISNLLASIISLVEIGKGDKFGKSKKKRYGIASVYNNDTDGIYNISFCI